MLGRVLATVAVALALAACGSRTPLRLDDDESLDEFSQAGAAGQGSGAGGHSGDRGGAGVGSGGRGGSGAGGHGAENSAGDGSAGMAAGSSAGGQGGTGTGGAGFSGGGFGGGGFGGAGTGGAGFGGAGGFPAGQGGVGGMAGSGEGGFSGMAGEILNPQGCATPHPFVLSIDPMGTSGNVRGWLESAAGMVFEEQLPRFVRAFGPDRPVSQQAIALWWSISSVGGGGQGDLYFYAGDFTNSTTEVAVAHGVSRFADIDVDALELTMEAVMAKTGSFVVYRNVLTGETLAMRVDEIFVTDVDGDALCAAVDASWRFLR